MPPDLPLHEGSRWYGDHVVDNDEIRIGIRPGEPPILCIIHGGPTYVYPQDVLAVLTKAGLNPYAERCRELETRLRELVAKVKIGDQLVTIETANEALDWLDGDNDG